MSGFSYLVPVFLAGFIGFWIGRIYENIPESTNKSGSRGESG